MANEAAKHRVRDAGHGSQNRRGRTRTEPTRISAGTRASAGMGCSMGLSQSFFTVKPLPAI